ncbi:adenine phosphoribosyltransferase [Pseudonocardiaceae bacterium YIM PH 21723]|nr:adenine phosphoribosyltransferase [Pseudonocardiaceae bacterium YIM PH 21723]
MKRAASLVRDVPDYPRPGILFRDLTPLMADAEAFAAIVDKMAEKAPKAELVAGIESRGFLFAAAVAARLGVGVVPLRKPGKLPRVAHSVHFALEYGFDSLELPDGCVRSLERVVVVDDVLATGGTLKAACELLHKGGALITGALVALELVGLRGRDRVAHHDVQAVLTV